MQTHGRFNSGWFIEGKQMCMWLSRTSGELLLGVSARVGIRAAAIRVRKAANVVWLPGQVFGHHERVARAVAIWAIVVLRLNPNAVRWLETVPAHVSSSYRPSKMPR